MGTVWGQCGDNAGTMWGQYGNSEGTVWGQWSIVWEQ